MSIDEVAIILDVSEAAVMEAVTHGWLEAQQVAEDAWEVEADQLWEYVEGRSLGY